MPASSTIFCCRAPEEQEHADQKPRKLTQVKPAQRSGAPARLDLERQRLPSYHNHATSTHRQSSLRTHLLKTCDGLMALPLQVGEEESRRLIKHPWKLEASWRCDLVAPGLQKRGDGQAALRTTAGAERFLSARHGRTGRSRWLPSSVPSVSAGEATWYHEGSLIKALGAPPLLRLSKQLLPH
jgi:hypothetical protein